MKNLAIRLLTAAVAVPIILYILYGLPWWAFGVLAAAALVIAALEFFQLTHRGDRIAQAFGLVVTGALFADLVATNLGAQHAGAALLALFLVMPIAVFFTLLRPQDQSTALTRMGALTLGPLYVGTSLAAITCLRRVGTTHQGAGLVVLTLMTAWFGDTGGYFVGKSAKGPKLYPSVSPNKTWSGAVGGLIGSACGALMAHYWYLRELPLTKGLIAVLVAGAVGQAGDLCESLMKRSAGVKDSGGILPGHGGILDRIDAMLFASLALYGAVRSGWLVLG